MARPMKAQRTAAKTFVTGDSAAFRYINLRVAKAMEPLYSVFGTAATGKVVVKKSVKKRSANKLRQSSV